jgi:FAD/FMN-containing dehydrogenase
MTTEIGELCRALDDRLDGGTLLPGDPGYEQARTVWNAMVDRHPQVIVRCASTTDVVAAVRFAREKGLTVGVRCGGHSVAGHAVPDGGLMIDLTLMGAVRVEPGQRRAWVQGGALLRSLDVAAQQHGLATTAGNVSHTGVGGLTLGGGMGWLARQLGLSCDNVESYEVVTAGGAVLRATATEHSDLYWGLRGGGGNFGVVTEFEFRLHPAGTTALVVELTFPVTGAASALRRWRNLSADAPRQATFTATVGVAAMTSMPTELRGQPVVTVGMVWVGDTDEGRRLVPALRALGLAAAERVEEMSYLELQARDDVDRGHAVRRYMTGHYIRDLSDEVLEAFRLQGAPDGGDHLPAMSLQAYGGAIGDVADEDAAFSHRDTRFELVIATGWTDPSEDEPRITGLKASAGSFDRFAIGQYVNTLTDQGVDGVRRSYPPVKLARLTALKDTYDPDNVFRLNQNIAPSTST